MKDFFLKKIPVNYVFFGFIFFILSLVHCYHVGILEQGSNYLKSYFILHAVLETGLETGVLVLVLYLTKSHLPKFFKYLTVSAVFILFLAHILEFPLMRIMDFSVWYALGFVTQESYQNLIEMLYASHVSLTGWLLGILLAILLMFLGLFFYAISEKITAKRPVYLSCNHLIIFCALVPCFLIAGDHLAIRMAGSSIYTAYQKTLPCKDLFFSCQRESVELPSGIKNPKSEKEIESFIYSRNFAGANRPNIYIFVIESLREDFLTEQVAPHLAEFKRRNLSSELSFSSANGTQISWFSIFYSKFPFYFNIIEPSHWHRGSPSLQILRKMGYKIEIYSSVRLAYYQMQELLFGKKEIFCDAYYLYPTDDNTQAHACDKKTIDKLKEEMQKDNGEGGRCYIIFLESTHFGYSWPDQEKNLFEPVSENINYFSIALSKKNLEKVKNRYRNAVNYVDALFGEFINTLSQSKQADSSIVVVTGDHGEEFYEEGHLFHASNLSHPQTRVPIYYKLGDNQNIPGQVSKTSSHIDIFPTLFDYLLKEEKSYQPLFDGESIFKKDRWPYMISGRYNAGRSPYEFFIHDGTYKMIAQFANKKEIVNSQAIQVLSLQNLEDEHLPYSIETIQKYFGPALERLFSP